MCSVGPAPRAGIEEQEREREREGEGRKGGRDEERDESEQLQCVCVCVACCVSLPSYTHRLPYQHDAGVFIWCVVERVTCKCDYSRLLTCALTVSIFFPFSFQPPLNHAICRCHLMNVPPFQTVCVHVVH